MRPQALAIHHYSSNYDGLTYPIQDISNSLDWVNVMAYDFIAPGWQSNVTGPPAALYNPTSQVSGDSGITAWIQAGVSANKLVLGLPFYGYAWTLLNADDNGIFAPANRAAISSTGAIAYSQINNFISQNSATTVYNSTFVTDYCYSGTTWIGYDDTQSISTKVTYAKENGLLGYFAWQLGQDPNFILFQTGSYEFNHLIIYTSTCAFQVC